ncbi:50S ribosomal protein L11 methyltransferase [Xanthomonas arboricola]|uniref:50S ribosomal protein L11 methyltransferase n=1 Tax=Xanthomonas arboricola TaxID=56448 RepID=UPI001622973F|nr:50S ribosomal protein L11 methyltransferase [Xanthomonas arboricola]MBB5862359.1 SAM-dependent methyltransferase [Xanthomonas arboricola]
MVDWQDELARALGRGDPTGMKTALERVPHDVLREGIPVFSRMAEDALGNNDLEQALIYLDQLVVIEPDEVRWRAERARVNVRLDEPGAVIEDASRIVAIDPDSVVGHRLLADTYHNERDRAAALAAYLRVQALDPDDTDVAERIGWLQEQLRKDDILQQALDPESAAPPGELEPLPSVPFDPVLLVDPTIPESMNAAMVGGLRQHLVRYGAHQTSRNTLVRLDDDGWLGAWDQALRSTAGKRVLMHGSELGVLALRALGHGAAHVTIVEPSAIDARIASGVVQKHLLAAWHASHVGEIAGWNDEQRRASFETFAAHVDVLPEDDASLQPATYDWLVIPDIDHTLLGTGIVRIAERYRRRGAPDLRVLPGRARLFAMAVQWNYPGAGVDIRPLSSLRWSPYPLAVSSSADGWRALTAATDLGDIDLNDFAPDVRTRELTVTADGTVEAILFWFSIQLADARIDTGIDGGLRCLRPAAHYIDPVDVAAAESFTIRARIEATRLSIATVPPARMPRTAMLPSWYVPMVLDGARNQAYHDALALRLSGAEGTRVLDIGAGCGLLSVLAAQMGARVHACEVDTRLARIAGEVAAANGVDERVDVLAMDCRALSVPASLPERAELALFELFDCSLIGEGVLHFLAHAREHLLTDGANYLPMAGRLRAMLVEYRLDRILDIDVNLLNPYRFTAEFANVDDREIDYRPLSEPFDVFAFDFARAEPSPQEQELDLVAKADGIAGAVLFWFDLEMTPGRWLSNEPGQSPGYHWKQGLQFLPEVRVAKDDALPLIARHNGSSLMFRWRQDAVPPDAFSALPRFDPRVFQQASELQAQTADLFQHCRSDPAEYRRVAELAQRFAVDPAAHGIDPRIAERFVAKFLPSSD